MDIKVEVGPVTLDTPVGEHRVYDEDGDYTAQPVTLGEAIAKQVFADIKRGERYNSLRDMVENLRAEEIRGQIRPIVEAAVTKPIQRTNMYGSPTGEPITLTELIVSEAQAYLTKRDDRYGADKRTVIEKLVADAVDKAIRKELSEAIAEEKAKVVAAVRAKAADLIAEAVKAGVGR